LRNCDVPGHYSTYINRQNQSTTGKLWKMKQQDLIKELAVMFHLEQFAEDCFWKGINVE
jgi:hypothetical protein